MFSEQLRDLVDLAIVDGQISDNERQTLLRRAAKEGADADELEVYINSRLQQNAIEQQNQAEQKRKEQQQEEQQNKMLQKCPKCGRQIRFNQIVCACGFIVTKTERAEHVMTLQAELRRLQTKGMSGKKTMGNFEYADKVKEKLQSTEIPAKPVETLEFLNLAISNISKDKPWLYNRFLSKSVHSIAMLLIMAAILLVGEQEDYAFLNSARQLAVALTGTLILYFMLFGWWLPKLLNKVQKGMEIKAAHNEMSEIWLLKAQHVLRQGRTLCDDEEYKRRMDFFASQLARH